jgi:hypothetical protein
VADQRWITIAVQLTSGAHADMTHPPGRVMLVGPDHTFRDLANAINTAFARWDLSHHHEFELPDGTILGIPDDDFDDPDHTITDDTTLTVTDHLGPGDTFTYVFDLGDYWLHTCTLDNNDADPSDTYGPLPTRPVPIWGWGDIPDQYGRRWPNDNGDPD